MSDERMEALKRQVTETTSVEKSASTLLNGLKVRLDEAIANQDWGAVTQMSTDLDTSEQELAQAVAANTPAEGTGG